MKNLLSALILFMTAGFMACGGASSRGEGLSASQPDATPATVQNSPRKSLPKIVAFGDSLTAGYGLPVNQSYPSLLQKKLADDGYEYEVVNAGVSGDTSAGGLRRIDWALDGDVHVVILELGANDILRGQPIAEMEKNLSQIIQRAKSRGADVLLVGMYSPTNAGEAYQRQIHTAFRTLASEHQVPLMPFFLEGVAGDASLNLEDGAHPNAEGTKIVADNVYRYLKPMLDKRRDEGK